jgi:predicted PurR-regulated permease PerM
METPGTPPGRSQVSLTTVLTVSFGVLAVAAGVVFLLKTTVALTLAGCSAMAAVALDHGVSALAARGWRRSWAIAAVVSLVLAVLVGLGFIVVPPLLSQGGGLVRELPALWQKLQLAPWFMRLDAWLHVQDMVRDSGSAAVGAVNPLLSMIGDVFTALGGLLAFVVLAIFMLAFGRDLVTAAFAQIEATGRKHYEYAAAKIYRSVGGYLGGLLGICTVNGLLTTTVLFFLDVPYFLPLGVLNGLSSLVPYVGQIVVGGTITLITLAAVGPWTGLGVALYFVLYGQIEGNVLSPFVYRRTVHVNPLVTLLAVLFMVELMGLTGALVAVPLAAAAQIILAEIRRAVSASRRGAEVPDAP